MTTNHNDIAYRKFDVGTFGPSVWLDFRDKDNIRVVDSNDSFNVEEVQEIMTIIQNYHCTCTSSSQIGICHWCIDQYGVVYGY